MAGNNRDEHGNPLDAETAYNDGVYYHGLGMYDEAIARFHTAWEMSAHPGLGYNLAVCYAIKGDQTNTLEWFNYALHHQPYSTSEELYRVFWRVYNNDMSQWANQRELATLDGI